ncbi:relaxase/mobilization nuclease domain-containing protein, partial [Campylobacter jejuni]|nr:relaxase/mobilization nuclease domain-containing protein [Campylobacter jejuni]
AFKILVKKPLAFKTLKKSIEKTNKAAVSVTLLTPSLIKATNVLISKTPPLTPEQAHKNAVELAEHTKAWKGHEVLIATHIDKGHIHTHFIVNSVNYENGHKLQWM